MSVQIVNVRIAVDVGDDMPGYEDAIATDCINEALRELQRSFNPNSSILDYAIDGTDPSDAIAENYEEGDAFPDINASSDNGTVAGDASPDVDGITVDDTLLGPQIKAKVFNDRQTNVIEFNAAPWFAQAQYEDILALASIDWRGDYESDAVAQFFEKTNDEIANLFAYCHASQTSSDPEGFECVVNGDDALAWLKLHRNDVWLIIQARMMLT